MKHIFRFLGRFESGTWTLLPEEQEQICRVVRLAQGDQFEITDGRGNYCLARINACSKVSLDFDPISCGYEEKAAGTWGIRVGSLKHGTLTDVIPSLVELGVDYIAVFGQAQVAKERLNSKFQERCQRVGIQAAKLAKRCYFPTITFHDSLDSMLAGEIIDRPEGCTKLVADPSGSIGLPSKVSPSVGADIVVGGERGLWPAEVELLHKFGYRPVALSRFVLSSRTAVVSAASLLAPYMSLEG